MEIKVGAEVMSPRQRITSAGYAIRAETADQAQNANTVANVGVSATPAPNKILPLDNNAKLPIAALKVYDSGWFAVTRGSSYTKMHNLGSTKLLAYIWFSTDLSGSNPISVAKQVEQNAAGYSYSSGGEIAALNTDTYVIRTGSEHVCIDYSSYPYGGYISGYYRVILMAIE